MLWRECGRDGEGRDMEIVWREIPCLGVSERGGTEVGSVREIGLTIVCQEINQTNQQTKQMPSVTHSQRQQKRSPHL